MIMNLYHGFMGSGSVRPGSLIIILKYLKLDLRFAMNSKTNLKHFLYTKLKSNYNRLWFLSLQIT